MTSNKMAGNKKAFLMVSETIGLILGIIILVIAVGIYVKACSVVNTDPARIDFNQFFTKIDDLVKNGFEGETRTATIRLGRENFVLNLWSSDLEGFKDCYGEDVEGHWLGPGISCRGNDCLCLVQDFEIRETDEIGDFCGGQRKIVQYLPKPKGIYCVNVPEEYYIYGIDWKRWNSFGERSRRLELSMTKEGKMVYVCSSSPCQMPAPPAIHPTKSKEQVIIGFNNFVKEIDKLAKEGQEQEKREYTLTLPANNVLLNLWSSLNLDEAQRCTDQAEEHWIKPGVSCHNHDCICLVSKFNSEDTQEKGNLCGKELKIKKIIPTEISCVEIPEDYYVYGTDWGQWDTFGGIAENLKMSLSKKGKIIFVCRDSPCEIPSQIQPHPTKS